MKDMKTGLSQHLELTEQIISACYEVHNVLGPGLEERFYRDALAYELELRGMGCHREQEFSVQYKGKNLGIHRLAEVDFRPVDAQFGVGDFGR